MAEEPLVVETPVFETRRVVIEMQVNGPAWVKPSEEIVDIMHELDRPEVARAIHAALLRHNRRNGPLQLT